VAALVAIDRSIAKHGSEERVEPIR
jgi:hypothetical protein